MKMIQIYGSPRTSAGRCFWCLEEVGASYDKVDVDMRAGKHKEADYLAINPNGKIPALVDGDYSLWESMAINSYLAAEYKPELLGETAKEKGLVNQWTTWSIAELQPPVIDIFIQMVFVPEDKRDHGVIERAQKKLPEMMSILDDALKGKEMLVSNQFSLADLNTASVVMISEAIKFGLSEYSEIKRWMGTLGERPAFKKYLSMRS
jgi:glutathione S-transferase